MALNLSEITDNLVASPPEVFFRLKKALENPDSSFEDYTRIISGDPALAARLLKIVNSPFYGMPSRIETISHALNIVGTDELAELALATSVIAKFHGLPEDLISVKKFWEHSIAVGVAARLIARHKNAKQVERFYLAGMLHDIGRLVLFKEAPGEAMQIMKEFYQAGDKMLHEIERKVLGFTHMEIGGTLLKAWKLPESLVDSVLHHHTPLKATVDKAEATIVHVADFMVYELGFGNSGEPTVPPIDHKALAALKLTENFIRETRQSVTAQAEQAVQLFT